MIKSKFLSIRGLPWTGLAQAPCPTLSNTLLSLEASMPSLKVWGVLYPPSFLNKTLLSKQTIKQQRNKQNPTKQKQQQKPPKPLSAMPSVRTNSSFSRHRRSFLSLTPHLCRPCAGKGLGTATDDQGPAGELAVSLPQKSHKVACYHFKRDSRVACVSILVLSFLYSQYLCIFLPTRMKRSSLCSVNIGFFHSYLVDT